jgi:hypothetical protein
MSRESELAALAGKYPLWEAWRGMSGLLRAVAGHGRRAGVR